MRVFLSIKLKLTGSQIPQVWLFESSTITKTSTDSRRIKFCLIFRMGLCLRRSGQFQAQALVGFSYFFLSSQQKRLLKPSFDQKPHCFKLLHLWHQNRAKNRMFFVLFALFVFFGMSTGFLFGFYREDVNFSRILCHRVSSIFS